VDETIRFAKFAGEEAMADETEAGSGGEAGAGAGDGEAVAEGVAAARRTLDQARKALEAAAAAGDEAIAAEVEERPVTAVLVALAVGFIFGRAL
jgi:ElaB/YqjD/DUF883 family membrane-anchored ribosome-binding protein